jgi:hypothetical protein
MNLQILDNFLDENKFKELHQLFFSNKFSWFFIETMTEKDSYFFTHNFYNKEQIHSALFNFIVTPFIEKLNMKELVKARANLMLKKNYRYESEFHSDLDKEMIKNKTYKTAIFYLNTCDGHTLFEKNREQVKCTANRIVIFDTNFKHKAVSQLDTERRIVINFNYIYE